MYAAGRIPGSFFRREGRPSEGAILGCRLIDRALRPSFSDGYRSETQVVAMPLSIDGENPFDILALIGASAALLVSPIPFEGPIGAARLALIKGEWGCSAHSRGNGRGRFRDNGGRAAQPLR